MNLKGMKDSEQIKLEREFWEKIVENDGEDISTSSPLCVSYIFLPCYMCPLGKFNGCDCDAMIGDWFAEETRQNAEKVVDRLKDIEYKLFRLDR